MEINESFAYITCACGEKLQALVSEPTCDTDHKELSRIAQEHWAICKRGVVK